MKKIIFANDDEQAHCNKYLDLKGVAYHVVLINAIGLDEDGKIEYKKISDLYRYDKRIRNRLYKFIAAFEEQLRGFLANSYNHGLNTLDLGDNITKELKNGSNIAFELEDLTFGQLIQIVERLTDKDRKRMFPQCNLNDADIIKNLNAIKELRNAISHHRILLLYDELESCLVNGEDKADLTNNIKNLINLIDDFYKTFLIDAINNAIYTDDNLLFMVPNNLTIKI